MKKTVAAAILILSMSFAYGQSLVETKSPHSPKETMDTLKEVVEEKGLKIFTEIDHTKAAREAGMELPSVQVLIFGNPKVGTTLMQADPRMGLELPLKILIWDKEGETFIGYTNSESYAERYDLEEQKEVLKKVHEALEGIVKAVTQE